MLYTPNLELGITVPGWEREQGRFCGSREGARGRSKGAQREHEGASREYKGASREHWGAASEERKAQQERRGSGSSESLIWLPPIRLQLLLLFT